MHWKPCLSDKMMLRNFEICFKFPYFGRTTSHCVWQYNIMERNNTISRRTVVKSSIFGWLAVSIPSPVFSNECIAPVTDEPLFYRYPAISDSIVSEVVGVSHFDLDRLKTLVDKRPELARAAWDWGFGDFETAIGAASHVGRKDIVEYLLQKGARPDLFTFAMLGDYETVKSMLTTLPVLQKTTGPHGITLLQHAKTGSASKDLSKEKKEEYNALIQYLESLKEAVQEKYIPLTEAEQQKYLGDYKYGEGSKDGFTIRLNMKKVLSLGKIGTSGGALYKINDTIFRYNGTSSVEITFLVENDKVISLTVNEPGLTLIAKKIN